MDGKSLLSSGPRRRHDARDLPGIAGRRVRGVEKFDTWHPAVRLFRVIDVETNRSRVLLPRPPSPRREVWACRHLSSTKKMGRPVRWIVCYAIYQLPRPTASPHYYATRTSSVLPRVRAHHAVCRGHGNWARQVPARLHGAPSQMLENWCWTVEGLKRLSKHHETGAALQRCWAKCLREERQRRVELARQIYLSTLDLEIHGTNPPTTAEGLQALVDRCDPRSRSSRTRRARTCALVRSPHEPVLGGCVEIKVLGG